MAEMPEMVCEKTLLGCPFDVPLGVGVGPGAGGVGPELVVLEPAGVVGVALGVERLREAELASMVRSGPEGRLEANGARGRVGSDWKAVDMKTREDTPRG